MPAVKLDQLKLESANLAGKYSRPDIFVSKLRDLLSAYSNRTFRLQVETGRLKPTPSYHVPEKVLWQVERDVIAQQKVHTFEQALVLANMLWESPSFEEKCLAITMLGEMTLAPAELLAERFRAWYGVTSDHHLIKLLVSVGSRALRSGNWTVWQGIQKQFTDSHRTSDLISLIEAAVDEIHQQGVEATMRTLEVVDMVLKTNDLAILPEVLQLFAMTVSRSRMEAAFFLRKIMGQETSLNPLTERFIKRAVALFPVDMQSGLRGPQTKV